MKSLTLLLAITATSISGALAQNAQPPAEGKALVSEQTKATQANGTKAEQGTQSPEKTGQETRDPTVPSKTMKELDKKIRGVAELEKLRKELTQMKRENEQLQATIAGLKKELNTRTAKLPPITLRARLITEDKAVAQLGIGESRLVVREGSEVSVPMANDETTTLKVTKITADVVEIELPELKRTLTLLD